MVLFITAAGPAFAARVRITAVRPPANVLSEFPRPVLRVIVNHKDIEVMNRLHVQRMQRRKRYSAAL